MAVSKDDFKTDSERAFFVSRGGYPRFYEQTSGDEGCGDETYESKSDVGKATRAPGCVGLTREPRLYTVRALGSLEHGPQATCERPALHVAPSRRIFG